MADQKAPGNEDSESALMDEFIREMVDIGDLLKSLNSTPKQVKDAFVRRINLSLELARQVGVFTGAEFWMDPDTFDIEWEGNAQDWNEAAMKRAREKAEAGCELNNPKRAKIDSKEPDGTNTDGGENRLPEKGLMDNVLGKVQALSNRADDWDKLKVYLEFVETPTYKVVKRMSDELEERVFSHVNRVLVPESAHKPYTGCWDCVTRAMLLVTGRISSDAFESGDYEFEKILLSCQDRSQEGNLSFRMIGVLLREGIDPDDMEMAMKPWVQKLIGLESVAKQIEVYQLIKDILKGKGDKA
ncbi:hypothetical protein CDV36_011318 [Fusarium kuroshium]|uniref:Uncharacterized protein n=2 Tax=Fusarium solani species complex TaxID=232080 RepID=A0A3M2RV61_9HYPO|nr:hypothetical protein CDV36_011318 [Fusarium kuroshium]RSL75025.1 hypothetical protein CEP51_011251 [Fusarium floridanum]